MLAACSISYLANVLQTMVPESLQFLDSVCSKHYGHQYTSQAEHRAPGVAETHTILTLLSAMLERNCPTREGTTLYGSRSSSSLRSSSFAGSITSSRCGSAASRVSSVAEFPDQLPPLTGDHPTPDRGLSEMEFSFSHSNLDSVETQTLCILTFAFIWSIGAYIPFRSIHSLQLYAHTVHFFYAVKWIHFMSLPWDRSTTCQCLSPSLKKAVCLTTTWTCRRTSLSSGQIARDDWLPGAMATSPHLSSVDWHTWLKCTSHMVKMFFCWATEGQGKPAWLRSVHYTH